MTSISELTERPTAFKLDLICQKLQQDTSTESADVSLPAANPDLGDGGGSGSDQEDLQHPENLQHRQQQTDPQDNAPPDAEDPQQSEDEEDEEEEGESEERRLEESDSDTADCDGTADGATDVPSGGGWPWATTPMSADQHPLPFQTSSESCGRRNKRKNFQPRAIVYQYASNPSDATTTDDANDEEGALDLTESRSSPSTTDPSAPMDLTVRTPTQINRTLSTAGEPPGPDVSEINRYAENTMRELLGMYGFQADQGEQRPPAPGMLFERLTSRLPVAGLGGGGGGGPSPPATPPHQPPTPPRTPRAISPGAPPPPLEQQRRLLAAAVSSNGLLLPQNMATLLRFAAFNQDRGPVLPTAHNAHVVSSGTPVPPSGASPAANGLSSLPGSTSDRRSSAVDYGRYVRRYGSAQECGFNYCSDLSYREHFHCMECNSRVFVKKEEMIRHFKWHKKRDDSLQHGFMRYSPTDDCGDRYPDCTHNRRQTHYHCLKDGCDKVYISTSDVQMHANYHRKDSAIQQEGFQRFRASEDCAEPLCTYQGQRTTHFHCKRPGCTYTFKNKADMEKHKTYHIKDEQLNKDGFKKFIKHEHCPFENCRFSKVCNHIHCIRPGCSYVLHSSGQLYSHKMSHFQRKHERQDSETAYRNYRMMQSLPSREGLPEQFPGLSAGSPLAAALGSRTVSPSIRQLTNPGQPSPSTSPGSTQSPLPASPSEALRASPYGRLGSLFPGILNPANFSMEPLAPQDMKPPSNAPDLSDAPQMPEEELMQRFVLQLTDGSKCDVTGCEFSGAAHYHCSQPECGVLFQSREGAREHARNHELQQRITETHYDEVAASEDPCPCQQHCLYRAKERHFHCAWEGCSEVILLTDKPFRRLDHYKMHDYSRRLALSKETSPSLLYSSRAEAALRRARLGQPAGFQLPVSEAVPSTPPTLFGSFKLPRPWPAVRAPDAPPTASPVTSGGGETGTDAATVAQDALIGTVEQPDQVPGFQLYQEEAKCPDSECTLVGRRHQHCARPRCFFASADVEDLRSHATDFHDNVNILDGFAFYNRDVDCRMPGCMSNKVNRHFHCTRPKCGHSFVRYLTMAEHEQLHRSQSPPHSPLNQQQLQQLHQQQQQQPVLSAAVACLQNGAPVVKAAGTYYPLSAFATPGMPQGLVLHSRVSQPGLNPSGDAAVGDAPGRSPPPAPAQNNQPTVEEEQKRTPVPTGTDLVSRLLQSPAVLPRPPISSTAESFSHFSEDQSCGRPFCKLKRRQHFHCELCNQGFSEAEKLQQHLERHADGRQSPQQQTEDGSREREEEAARQREEERAREAQRNIPGAEVIPEVPRHPMLPFHPFHSPFLGTDGFLMRPGLHPALAGFPMLSAPPGGLPLAMGGSLLEPSLLVRKRLSDGAGDHLRPPEQAVKKPRNMRVVKDEPVPEGYIRFRFNEDCKYPHCGYREHQTHFHCIRKDCGYSFCDKTRFVQHTARHERLDTLMGGDFVQYRANINCGREACIYANTLDQRQNKASHFHCLKCEFVCTDTNKVVAHRRQHTKLDSITQAGFKKFTPSQACDIESCTHNNKQTHYHCVTCHYAVLGLSQMNAHKYRHME